MFFSVMFYPFLKYGFSLKVKLTNGARIPGQLIPVTIHLCTSSAGITGIHQHKFIYLFLTGILEIKSGSSCLRRKHFANWPTTSVRNPKLLGMDKIRMAYPGMCQDIVNSYLTGLRNTAEMPSQYVQKTKSYADMFTSGKVEF